MSRIGKLPITLPAKVEIKVADGTVQVKGPKGELTQKLNDGITVKIDGTTLTVERATESKEHRAQHGLYRSLINNMVIGVSQGFKKEQELVGVGYKASNQGQLLDLVLGYSHHVIFDIPAEVKVSTKQDKGQNPMIILESADKQLLGAVAAKIRSLREPEPYKGKGVKFVNEVLRRKAGKSAAKK
ncbi:MAG: 50S ribosomal protein L6 [Bacteroidota bacterium]|jgi:large subunit ribosomal protein L6|uniref:50S ribosomal protein L6 n=1 Tax=Candidatus Pollutiaquabacter sp. TaxID=3416354 RepID=UPI001A4794EC|nr:50S ribosomal protein L6 [Bacteroidota bacterium]MBL7949347.1 50S ribosomal protein L6 [Bacteroidia bacterium]MBP6009484.1 50S ribosomal protein L6 [Bacteroidia bacterium]MBP7268737.1 50S ribosomal protein L6 [Bacteroidia bacterium]MBP7437265.1 50S ribosomal protein L6 [Bacteroidia bacterium]